MRKSFRNKRVIIKSPTHKSPILKTIKCPYNYKQSSNYIRKIDAQYEVEDLKRYGINKSIIKPMKADGEIIGYKVMVRE